MEIKNFLGLEGLKHFWTKSKSWIAGQITDEATARANADTALQQSIKDLETSFDEKLGNIDITSALSHIKQYDHVIDSDETLLEWANCTDGSMKSVLIKSGEYTLDGKEINLVNAGTKFVFAEDGNKITVSNDTNGIAATKDYGAIIIGLNIEVKCKDTQKCYAFYLGMVCYNCTGKAFVSGTGNGYGFSSCTCINCTGYSRGEIGDGYGYGFSSCTCINCTGETSVFNCGYAFSGCTCCNCTSDGSGLYTGYGFYSCTCNNCTGAANGCTSSYAFDSCTCNNCTGNTTTNGTGCGFNSCICSNCTGSSYGTKYGYGFNGCNCSNCIGSGISGHGGRGYGFYNCSYCSSCRAEKKSTTATWGGTNTYIDSDSCDYVAS